VQALDGVEISVDGEVRGITYNGQLVVMLDPGTYTLTAEKEGYGSSSHRVEIKSGEATNLKIEMRSSRVQSEALGAEESMILGQKTGTIEVRSVPFSGADITINGTSYGKTDTRLRSFPVGPVRISARYGGRTISGNFELKEDETMKLQANFALTPAAIIELFHVTFSVNSTSAGYPYTGVQSRQNLSDILPSGYYMEIEGAYGKGIIDDIGSTVLLMGSEQAIRYTNGTEYLDFSQDIDLKSSSVIQLEIPNLTLEELKLVTFGKDLGVGNTYKMETEVTPDYLKGIHLSWSSSREDIVSVSEQGELIALKPGYAVITVIDELFRKQTL